MMLLWETDHQTVGQLGSRLALDSGTLSPLLKRLTAAGLVTRHRRVEDERSVSIALTDEGRALRDKAFAISEEMIGAIGFDTGEFDDLKQRLRLLTERVNTRRSRLLKADGPARHRPGKARASAVQGGRRPAREKSHGHSHRTHRLERHPAGRLRPDRAGQLRLGTFDVSWPKRTSDAADGRPAPRS